MPRRPDPPDLKAAKGRTAPSDQIVPLFPNHAARPDPDVIDPPKWLSRGAKAAFRTKVERYRQRGQKVEGFEDALAQYCALEDEIIDLRRKRIQPTITMITAHRLWAVEFYDTPAGQKIGQGSGNRGVNRFARNGRRS
jgi:hypothetical protein